jgi:hypothetical protein
VFGSVGIRTVGGQGRPSGRLRVAGAQRDGQMLVDVGVDGQRGQPLLDQMPDEQRGQRGLAAAALADKRRSSRSTRPHGE